MVGWFRETLIEVQGVRNLEQLQVQGVRNLEQLIELKEVKYNYGENATGARPITFSAHGRVYVRSSKLDEKGKFTEHPHAYKIFINEVDTGSIIGSEDLKKYGRIVLEQDTDGKLISTVGYPVSEFDPLMLRIFRFLRGNDYPRVLGQRFNL